MAASSTRSTSPRSDAYVTAAVSRARFVKPSVIPGFGITFGLSVTYLTLIVLIPLAGLALNSAALGPAEFWRLAADPRTLAALKISFGSSLVAALVNVVFGLVVAWVLVRYEFPGRRLLDAAVDLPFALPTAVAGIALSALYAPKGWIGEPLSHLGIKVAYTPSGIVVALIFIGLPFIVRTVQPVLEDFETEVEEAAATLGASRLQTITQIMLPRLFPAILTGFSLAFARAVGEYGSVIFIASNIPYKSEIAPQLIIIRLQEFNQPAAAAIGMTMLIIAFLLLLVINLLQAWSRRRFGGN
jgi:sulfate/thiosulfate transport system permease protein